MRWWGIALFLCPVAAQQTAAPVPVQGVLLERDPAASGDLSVRVPDDHVYCFRFDPKTAVERGGAPASVAALRPGDIVEITADPGPRTRLRYASSVRVVTARSAPAPARRRAQAAADPSLVDELFPRGNLTFSGVVVELNREALVLRTKAQGEARFLLRPDTRFLYDGLQVPLSRLRINSRVFVRAARNLDKDLEAHQVMWGNILKPGGRDAP